MGLPEIERRNIKTIELFCKSLFWDYDKIKVGEYYSYDDLVSKIKGYNGESLKRRPGGGKGGRDIQFDAWRIILDIEEVGATKDKMYHIVGKHNYSIDEKIELAEEIMEDYLLSRDNQSGLIYEIVLCLLWLRGRFASLNDAAAKQMEFSKSKWEVEIGMVSRVFQKMFINGNNVLTQTILGNILKTAVNETKKNMFLRALEFINKDPSIDLETNTKILYINLSDDCASSTDIDETKSAAEVNLHRQIKYKDNYYTYKTTYANTSLIEIIRTIEDQVVEEMGFDSQKQIVAAGKYLAFKNLVEKRISDLDFNCLSNDDNNSNSNGLDNLINKPVKYKVLHYWKTYRVKMSNNSLEERVKKIIKNNLYLDPAVDEIINGEDDDNKLLSRQIVENYLGNLKKEVNEYVKARVSSKVDLDGFDFNSEEGKAIVEELSWISYFAKYANYRIYSQEEWNNFLFGSEMQAIEKDGLRFLFDDTGTIIGMIDDNYNRINFSTGEILKDKTDDFRLIAELDELLVEKIIEENKDIVLAREKYSGEMRELVKSLVLSPNGEISEKGFDLETMNEKIRELMQVQFKPQEDAERLAYKIMKDNKRRLKEDESK